MQKITPFLWFDGDAAEAMDFYVSVFDDAKIVSVKHYPDAMPEMAGKVLTGVFRLAGHEFMALDGGPQYKFTPAVSFFVKCASPGEVDGLYEKLSEGGEVLMPLQAYPFSERYAWVQDRYGVSWQLILGDGEPRIKPSLMFVGDQNGRAEEAMRQYVTLFKDSAIRETARYGPDQGGTEGTLMYASFTLHGQEFVAMDSSIPHAFTFTEAVSLYVDCASQSEVDALWENLSDGGEVLMCGWLKDKYGVTWQIIPSVLPELLSDPDPGKAERVMDAMLRMKKIDIAALQKAYDSA
jgi:predicted 3-demethylubiquinone-9 3-methyltransferase (glyoxalase superfamily)